jgi:hypothetical protein
VGCRNSRNWREVIGGSCFAPASVAMKFAPPMLNRESIQCVAEFGDGEVPPIPSRSEAAIFMQQRKMQLFSRQLADTFDPRLSLVASVAADSPIAVQRGFADMSSRTALTVERRALDTWPLRYLD